MKRIFPTVLGLAALLFLSGCIAAIGNGPGRTANGTLGQELMDLKKAKENGAMTEAEYEVQKARLLRHK